MLWPAFEYTVLVFGHEPREYGSEVLELNPFERAVYGASAANVLSIVEQAEVLDLNQNFVAHIHERLMERGVFDDYSRIRGTSTALADDEVMMAARIYQDPWSGSLWPRFVTDERRRTVPVISEPGRRRLAIGTTGSPIEVSALYLNQAVPERSAPSSDDAVHVFAEWSRLQRSHRLLEVALPKNPAARVLPDSREAVLLCCPSERGFRGRPQVHDPFGGPEWSPFARSLVAQAEDFAVLDKWLFDPGAIAESHETERTEVVDTDADNRGADALRVRLRSIVRALQVAQQQRRETAQLHLDLEAVGHEALDILWKGAPLPPQQVVKDPLIDEALLQKIALMVGFNPPDVRAPTNLWSLVCGERGALADRCTALLLLFPPDRHGPLHKLAQREPRLFEILGAAPLLNAAVTTDGLSTAVQALAATAMWSTEDTTQGTHDG